MPLVLPVRTPVAVQNVSIGARPPRLKTHPHFSHGYGYHNKLPRLLPNSILALQSEQIERLLLRRTDLPRVLTPSSIQASRLIWLQSRVS